MKHCYSCQFWDKGTMNCHQQVGIVSKYNPACEQHQWAEEFDIERLKTEISHIQMFLLQFGYDKNHVNPLLNGLQARNRITSEMENHVYQEIQKIKTDWPA